LTQPVYNCVKNACFIRTGRKIEVRIITAEVTGMDSDDMTILSEEESKQFQKFIITILAGDQDAAEEMERHKKLEESYRFVWQDHPKSESKEEDE